MLSSSIGSIDIRGIITFLRTLKTHEVKINDCDDSIPYMTQQGRYLNPDIRLSGYSWGKAAQNPSCQAET